MNEATNTPPLFYKTVVPFNKQTHGDLALPAEAPDYFFAAKTDIIPVLSGEVPHALQHYPLIFIKDGTTASAAPTLAALVGMGDGKNQFIDEHGQWRIDSYIPAWVRRYPFLLARNDSEQNNSLLAFDPEATIFTALGDKQRLVEKDGEPSARLQQIMEFQKEFEAIALATQKMVQDLHDAKVLEEGTLTIKSPQSEETRNVQGFLMVNENKLRELPAAETEKLQKSGAMGLAYAQIFSMVNLRRLNIGA